jgi:hypothetical protein
MLLAATLAALGLIVTTRPRWTSFNFARDMALERLAPLALPRC